MVERLFQGVDSEWLVGFSKYIWLVFGVCCIVVDEGLKLAQNRGFQKVEVRVDSKAVWQSLNNSKRGHAAGDRQIDTVH
jgi:hypothetical protein